MIWDPPWTVLAPGEPTWLTFHARVALGLEEEDGYQAELPFKIAPGENHYHAIIAHDATSVGDEKQIAEHLSLLCSEPVYSTFSISEASLVFMYRNGAEEMLDVEPRELARSLGCPFPKSEETPEEAPRSLKTVALVEGVHSQAALRALEEEAGHPLAPGRYRLEDTPQGLLMTDGTGGLGFADITLSDRFPYVTVYSVTASPSLHIFIVSITRGEECLGQFAQPPRESSVYPPVGEVKGERTPERILAALGIPAEWFR